MPSCTLYFLARGGVVSLLSPGSPVAEVGKAGPSVAHSDLVAAAAPRALCDASAGAKHREIPT